MGEPYETSWQGVGHPPLIPLEGLGASLGMLSTSGPAPGDGFRLLGNDDIKSGDGGGGGVVWLWGLGLHFGLSVGFWVGDGRPGTRFSGGGRPAWFSPVFLCYMADKRGVLARGRLCHQFLSFPDPLGGVGRCFLAAVAGLMGISEGNDGGDVSKGHKARGFSAGLLSERRAA